MSVEFTAELDRPASLGELASATETMLAELLDLSVRRVPITVLDDDYYWKTRSDRPADQSELSRVVGVDDEARARFTLTGGSDGSAVALTMGMVLTRSSRTCLSTIMSIATVLAGARLWGHIVDPAAEICAQLPPPAGIDYGRPVEEIVSYLKPPSALGSLEEAVVAVLSRTVYPCDEWATSDAATDHLPGNIPEH
jgi:hypothetical protein